MFQKCNNFKLLLCMLCHFFYFVTSLKLTGKKCRYRKLELKSMLSNGCKKSAIIVSHAINFQMTLMHSIRLT